MDWNYGDMLDAVARVVPPNRPAIICGEVVVEWHQFDIRTNNLARGLSELALKPGDRAAILCRNHPSYLEAMGACAKARIVSANLNYRYTAAEISYVLTDCHAACTIYQDAFDHLIDELRATFPSMIWVRIETDRRACAPRGASSFEALATSGDGAPLDVQRSPDDGYLQYTGGTTGHPKGVYWPMGQARKVSLESPITRFVPTSMQQHTSHVQQSAPPSVIPACPLMHGTGGNAAITDLLNGGTVVLLPSARFDPVVLWREAARNKVTRISIVGDVFAKPMLEALRASPERLDLSSLKTISSSGLTWTHDVKLGLLQELPWITLVDVVGASEASGFGFAVSTYDRIHPSGVFDAGPKTVLIDPDTDEILSKDSEVEGLIARSGVMANGYFGDEAKTAATYRMIGGVRYAVPGDLARWLPPNQFTMIGRGNLSINTGGEKVFPEEIEEALKLQAGIEDALVIGCPDEKWGKIVVAIVRTAGALDEDAIRASLSKQLSSYKLPKKFITVDQVPRHESGKPDYRRAVALAGEIA